MSGAPDTTSYDRREVTLQRLAEEDVTQLNPREIETAATLKKQDSYVISEPDILSITSPLTVPIKKRGSLLIKIAAGCGMVFLILLGIIAILFSVYWQKFVLMTSSAMA